jgi:hypothetical protein
MKQAEAATVPSEPPEDPHVGAPAAVLLPLPSKAPLARHLRFSWVAVALVISRWVS